MRFQVITAVLLKIQLLSDVTPCLAVFTDVSTYRSDFIFKVQESKKNNCQTLKMSKYTHSKKRGHNPSYFNLLQAIQQHHRSFYALDLVSYLNLAHLISVYTKKCAIIYKRTNVMQLGSMFICNCNIALHVSDDFCFHVQEHLETVTHQRLLLQFKL